MQRQIGILRTHRFDAQAENLLEWVSRAPGMDWVVCADERNKVVETGRWPKVSLTPESLARLGLYQHKRVGWQCGDYCYYHVLEQRPDYDFYWMIEPDVLFAFGHAAEFFGLFDAADQDLLSARFGDRPTSWGWFPAMARGSDPVFGCLFPMTRLSRRAVTALYQGRREASAEVVGERKGRTWPNDESFVATSIARGGFTAADFNEAAGKTVWTKQTFRAGNPQLLQDVMRRNDQGLVHHPVLNPEAYISKLRSFLLRGGELGTYHDRVLRRFFPTDVADKMRAVKPRTTRQERREKRMAAGRAARAA